MSKKMIRVVALLMALLMIGGVFAAALNVFALDPAAAAAVVETGDSTRTAPAIIAITAAIVAIALCVIIPKLTKKK